MTSSGKLLWFSPRSWVINDRAVLCRPSSTEYVCGIGRSGGASCSFIISEADTHNERDMYEIFTTKGYSLVDAESSLVSADGLLKPSSILERIFLGEKPVVEEYLGEIKTREWRNTDIRPAVHSEYCSSFLQGQLMEDFLTSKFKLPYTIPRPLFSQAPWIIERLAERFEVTIRVSIDNRMLPSTMTLAESKTATCHVLAVTHFRENHPLKILAEHGSWHPVCDRLVIALF